MKKALFPIVALILALGLALLVAVPVLAAASISTDKGDYATYETVTIYGSGFSPSAIVTVTIVNPSEGVDAVYYVRADGAGNFTCWHTLNGVEGTYTVYATDGTNTATITFTEKPEFTATIAPTSANAGETKTYTITITNDASNPPGSKLGSATVLIPTGFTSVSITSVTPPAGKSWTGTVDSQIKLTANTPTDRLDRDQSVLVSFSATAPATAGTYEWTTTAYVNKDWGGDTFTLKETQPTVIVGPPATVSITITSSPTGTGFVKVDDAPYTTPTTFSWGAGSTHTLEALSPVADPEGTQYVWTNWSNSGTQKHIYTVPSTSETVTAIYMTQYRLSMASNFGTTSPSVGDHWYNLGTVLTISATPPSVGDGERYDWIGWTGTGTISYTGTDNPATNAVTMNSPVTETASWTHQYRLTMATNFGTTSPSVGDHWYDAGTVWTISATPPSAEYIWKGWTGTGTISYTGTDNPATNAVTMNSPVTETASFQPPSGVTFDQTGVGSDFSGTVLTVDSVGYLVGQLPRTFTWSVGSSHDFAYGSPLVVNGKQYVWTSTSGLSNLQSGTIIVPSEGGTVTGHYTPQYSLTMATNFGTTSPSVGDHWYDEGTVLTISATPPSAEYIWKGWTGTGTISYTGLDNPATNAVTMNSPITETASFQPPTPPPTPTPPPPVGGTIIPTDKLGLVMPWIMAAALIVVGGVSLAIWNKKRGTERASGR